MSAQIWYTSVLWLKFSMSGVKPPVGRILTSRATMSPRLPRPSLPSVRWKKRLEAPKAFSAALPAASTSAGTSLST